MRCILASCAGTAFNIENGSLKLRRTGRRFLENEEGEEEEEEEEEEDDDDDDEKDEDEEDQEDQEDE